MRRSPGRFRRGSARGLGKSSHLREHSTANRQVQVSEDEDRPQGFHKDSRLQEEIRARTAEYGPLIFGAHATTDANVLMDGWRRKLKRLWELCGPWPTKPTPRSVRHTFAPVLVQRPNVTVRDVEETLRISLGWCDGNFEALKLVSRRILCRLVRGLEPHMTAGQMRALVMRLDNPQLAHEAEWEVVVVSALKAIGDVSYETPLGGSTRPDILFRDGHGISIVADIRTLFDEPKFGS